MKEILNEIGINLSLTLAGLGGSIVTLWAKRKTMNWMEQAVTIFSGTLSANYLTPLVVSYLNMKPEAEYGVAFIIGFGGLKTVEYVYDKYFSKGAR